jgi:hypothetical protein
MYFWRTSFQLNDSNLCQQKYGWSKNPTYFWTNLVLTYLSKLLGGCYLFLANFRLSDASLYSFTSGTPDFLIRSWAWYGHHHMLVMSYELHIMKSTMKNEILWRITVLHHIM